MKLKTIWTIRGMEFVERLRRTRDSVALSVAKHLPLRIRYWCALDMIGLATMDSPNVPASTVEYILKHMPAPKRMH